MTPGPCPGDFDCDGLSDAYEQANGSDPANPNSVPAFLDFDGNGTWNEDDATALYDALLNDTEAPFLRDDLRYDMNGDGTVSILDAVLLYRNRMGLIRTLPL